MRPIRILFVTPYVPSVLRPRPFHLLKGLARRGHRVTLVAIATSPDELRHAEAVAPFCDEVRLARVGRPRAIANCLRAAATGAPLQALFCHSPVADRVIREELSRSGSGAPAFDVLHVEHLRAASYGLSHSGPVRVFDAVDCITQLLGEASRHGLNQVTRVIARFELERTRRFERAVLREFDRVLVSSRAELENLSRLLNLEGAVAPHLQALRNGVDLEYFRPVDEPRATGEIVFVGRMGYHANIAAAHRLLAEIMPLVWRERPDTRVSIVGEGAPSSLRVLAARHAERVRMTGYVDDVRPYLSRAAAVVCPLVYAAGVQNKVLEAMAMEAPVVASPVACAALDAQDGGDLLVARDDREFAVSIGKLFDDRALARRIGVAGRAYVSAEHDWEVVASRLELLYWNQMQAGEAGGR